MKSERKIIGLMLLYLVALVPGVRAAERKYSLILAEYGKDSGGTQTQTLVRYHFKGGTMVAKDNILTTRTSDLRYDLGRNQIYNDRYVITDWGDVIDLTTGQLLFKSKGRLVDVDKHADAVVVQVNRDNDEGIYAFDLASHQYKQIERPSAWMMPSTVSPDGQLSASSDNAEIWLLRPNGEKIQLGNGFLRSGTVECSSSAMPTFIWADDKHLLTQRGNGHLVIVDVEGKIEPLVTIQTSMRLPVGRNSDVTARTRFITKENSKPGALTLPNALLNHISGKRSVTGLIWSTNETLHTGT